MNPQTISEFGRVREKVTKPNGFLYGANLVVNCLTSGFLFSPDLERVRDESFTAGLMCGLVTDVDAPVGDSQSRMNSKRLRSERLKRIPNREEMSKSRLVNITSTVGLFEGWLWHSHGQEHRGIHEIAPQELDRYLAEFFSTIRLPNGSNYSPGSLKSLRSYLDFYLKCTGYPESITCSASNAFRVSQMAYRQKLREIKMEMSLS